MKLNPKEIGAVVLVIASSHHKSIWQNEDIRNYFDGKKDLSKELMSVLIGVYFAFFSLIVSQKLTGEPLNRFGGSEFFSEFDLMPVA